LSAGEPKPPSRVSKFEIATRDDLLFAYLVGPSLLGDVANWAILAGLGKQVGDWVNPYVDAHQIANVITEAFPIEGQPFRPLEQVVDECVKTLDIEKPDVYLRNSPQTRVYVVRAYQKYHLVLTSGLLNLYEGRPEELKFVVGRELGHIKCDHLELRNKAYGLISALQAINEAVVPDRYQTVFPTLALGRLYTWCRESEISADRAGLLCCRSPKVAYSAIMRLQIGLRPDSPWIDPDKDFNPAQVIRGFQQWQYRPLVKLIVDLKRHVLEQPFVPERLAALKQWADTGVYQKILERRPDACSDHLIEVLRIQAFELAPESETVDPYVIVLDGAEKVLQTKYASALRAAQWEGFENAGSAVNQPRTFRDGQPLFFEIWDADFGWDTFVGGFVVYPDSQEAKAGEGGIREIEHTTKILWDWKESRAISRQGYARIKIRFTPKETPYIGKERQTKR
jgi:Zn-dependent protease with chaperone function